ncbi:MAG: hypothetical protein CSYNP_03864 [Syntrophus sp. SKADARSKE-3]|nr:hypothetical protein [Syntrophus sp. SKADARSKE-3]
MEVKCNKMKLRKGQNDFYLENSWKKVCQKEKAVKTAVIKK